MLLLGSCLALNLSYSGCCVRSRTNICSNNGCFCHQNCHIFKTCCSDIANIGCHPASPFSPTVSLTGTDTPGMTKSEAPYFKNKHVWQNNLISNNYTLTNSITKVV